MNSWWELEVISLNGKTEEWIFDEEPEFSLPERYDNRVAGYQGTLASQDMTVRIVIDNVVSWTVSKVEEEEE